MNTDLQARPSARVVLVNWKNAPLTLRAARSIVPQLRAGDRLVIVDNGSEDDSLAVLDAHLPELLTGLRRSESGDGAATDIPIELVNAGVNGGFGAGVTAGAAGLSEDALVLLNNDATVREGFLDALLAPLGTPDVGATTALILLAGRYRHAREDEAQALSGNGPTRWVRQTDEETMQSEGTVCEAKDLDAAPDVFGLCGGACAIRRDAWEKVGGIRTDLFMYYEDTDLSYRLREAGYRVRFVREAVVDHEHAASSDATSPMFTRVNARNRLIVAVEHAPWPVVARALVRSLARAVRAGCRGPVAHGVAQGLASFPAALRARRTRKARRDGTPRRGDATTKKTLESE